MMAALRLASLILPLLGLAALWGLSDYQSRQGSEWEVSIDGYDPRDLLRGHYVEFTYGWDGLEDGIGNGAPPARLCLEGTPPGPPIALLVEGSFNDCEYPVEADFGGVYGAQSLIRGRLYVGQERALELQEQLLDPDLQGVVRIRLGTNRRITPLDISFRQRPETEREAVPKEE